MVLWQRRHTKSSNLCHPITTTSGSWIKVVNFLSVWSISSLNPLTPLTPLILLRIHISLLLYRKPHRRLHRIYKSAHKSWTRHLLFFGNLKTSVFRFIIRLLEHVLPNPHPSPTATPLRLFRKLLQTFNPVILELTHPLSVLSLPD